MTANNVPSPIVVSASQEANPAFKAFNRLGGTDNGWATNATTGWLKVYTGGAAKWVVTSYTISVGYWTGPSAAPKNWTLQGSNDNSTWTVLDSRINQVFVAYEMKSFSFSNSTEYSYFKLVITENNGDTSWTVIGEIELIGSVYIPPPPAVKRPLCNYSGTIKELASSDSLPIGSGMAWSVITASTTAVASHGYLVNASANDVTLTLPATPQVGDSVGICDAYRMSSTHVIAIAGNGNKIETSSENLTIDVPGSGFIMSYVDATVGWKRVSEIGADCRSVFTAPTLGTPVSGNLVNCTGFPGRNRIINGAMTIDQRNNGAEIVPDVPCYTLDRFLFSNNVASKVSLQQVVDGPIEFAYSAKLTVAAQYSPAVNDYFHFCQLIEGLNTADFAWGTANAVPITVSFWVKGSVPGIYSGMIGNYNGVRRAYAFSFPVTTSWVKQTITIPGCIDGTWNKLIGSVGVYIRFCIGSGSAYLISSGSWQEFDGLGATGTIQFVNQVAGSTLNITGVQLEKGSVATEFEFRSIGVELVLCQRYYETFGAGGMGGSSTNSTAQSIVFKFQTKKRSNPTITLLQNIVLLLVGNSLHTASLITSAIPTTTGCKLDFSVAPTPGACAQTLVYISAFDGLAASAEL